MTVVWGVVVLLLSLLGWGGQTLSAIRPELAQRFGLMEHPDDVDRTYWGDIRGEAMWDTVTLWVLVVAGALLIADEPGWAYFGLAGSGAYLYFAGRGIATRVVLLRDRRRIGSPSSVRTGLLFLTIWGVMAVVTLVLAIGDLETP